MPRTILSCCLWCCWTLSVAAADREFRVELVSGDTESFSAWTVSAAGVTGGDVSQVIPWNSVVAIRSNSPPPDWSRRSSIVWLSNGDRLIAEPVEMDEDSLSVRWLQFPSRDLVSIPLESVRAICLQTPRSITGRQTLFRELESDVERADVAWLTSGDRVSGEFIGLEAGEYLLKTPTGKLPIVKQKLAALRFDPELISPIKPTETRLLVTLTDGSQLTVSSLDRSADRMMMKTLFGANVSLPADTLASCRRFSPEVQSLSDRKPARVEMTPYLSTTWPLVTDANVKHGPLQIRGREYARGLGVRSKTSITYELEPGDREFRADVGIDDIVDGAGHVVFSVQVDDKIIWTSPGVTGTSDPLTVPPVDLRGKKRLTLLVDFGEQGDVGDDADWCDPIILRGP